MMVDCLIVIPTLGRRIDYLRQAITSIVSQARPADIVMVTPVAAAEARALAAEFGVAVADDPRGLSAAVNAGMAFAQPHHRFGNWLGDDDVLAPDSLTITAGVLEREPDVAVAYGRCTYVDGSGRTLWVSRAGRLAPAMLGWGPNLIPQPGMLFRLADFVAVGGLDDSLAYAMDLDLLLRLRRRGRLRNVGVPVSCFRWHADSLTVGGRSSSLAESEAIKRRYLAPTARRISPLWEGPVRLATRAAERSLNRRAEKITQDLA